MTISKSLFTCAIQCPKALWLKKHKSSMITSAEAIFETGNVMGALACELFPDGFLVMVK